VATCNCKVAVHVRVSRSANRSMYIEPATRHFSSSNSSILVLVVMCAAWVLHVLNLLGLPGCREEAERYLLRAGAHIDAVEMWMRAGACCCHTHVYYLLLPHRTRASLGTRPGFLQMSFLPRVPAAQLKRRELSLSLHHFS
jgi:hypothetical protein